MTRLIGAWIAFWLVACGVLYAAENSSPVSVVVLGTSLTAGATWLTSLGEELSDSVVRPVIFDNLAMPGANSDQARSQFVRRNARYPDVVLVEFSINDADIIDGVGLERSRENHEELIALIAQESPGSRVVLMTMNPAFGLRAWFRPKLVSYYALYRDIAEKSEVELLDLYSGWRAAVAEQDQKLLIPDGLHPTEEASVAVVRPLLRSQLMQLMP